MSDFSAQRNGLIRNGASLRDPAGYVFEKDGGVYRQLSPSAAADWARFISTDVAQRMFESGQLIPTSVFESQPDGGMVLSHERVRWLSYSSEWSFSMLRDAALMHVDLMEALVPEGWILKDAHPTNLQWHRGRMCLIDVASIQPYEQGAWRAYGQFCRTMLFPLLAAVYGEHGLQVLLRGFGRQGLDAKSTSRLIGWRKSFAPGVLVHVRLQSLLHGMSGGARAAPDAPGDNAAAAGLSAPALLSLLRSLRRALIAMPQPKSTPWTGYRVTSTYSEQQLQHKRAVVERWCQAYIRDTDVALDVGCNTGDYSDLLARHAHQVISIDADMPCVDEIYRRKASNILPLVIDFSDPTPAGGWALNEQLAFAERIRPDWSIWLAVIHHLAVHNGIRLDEVVRQIAQTSRTLIIEFVAPEDDMVRALLTERGVDRPDYTEAHFVQLLQENFLTVLASERVTSTRRLYLLRRS